MLSSFVGMSTTGQSLADRLIGTIWVCESCALTHNNGECGEIHAESCPFNNSANPLHDPDCESCECDCGAREPLSKVTKYEISAGMDDGEHDLECLRKIISDARYNYPQMTWPDVYDGYECDCEVIEFFRMPCDGCGSALHGTRYAFTAWIREGYTWDGRKWQEDGYPAVPEPTQPDGTE